MTVDKGKQWENQVQDKEVFLYKLYKLYNLLSVIVRLGMRLTLGLGLGQVNIVEVIISL